MHRKQENHTATSPCIRGQGRRIKKNLVLLKVNSHGFSKMANMCLRGNLNETPFKSDYFRDFNWFCLGSNVYWLTNCLCYFNYWIMGIFVLQHISVESVICSQTNTFSQRNNITSTLLVYIFQIFRVRLFNCLTLKTVV
jgi:hypothetical protein